MYKMIVVDDESWIRERLIHTIDWAKSGVEVVGEAGDGEEALKLALDFLPDIILTDIRMPFIDGLEFISRLKENHIESKVVLISGYSDFEYAQKAVKLGAFDYILKPAENNDLVKVVERCVGQLDAEKQKAALFENARIQLEESLPLLKEKFLIDLVNSHFKSEEELIRELDYLKIAYKEMNHICFIIQIDDFKSLNTDEKWDKHLTQYVVENISRDFIKKLDDSELLFSHLGEVACIVSSPNTEDVLTRQVMSISGGIKKIIKSVLGATVTIGLGGIYSSFIDMALSYMEAKQALHCKTYLGKDRIYNIRSIEMTHKPNFYKFIDTEVLLNNIKIGDKERALSSLAAILHEIGRTAEVRPIDLKLIYIDIVNSIFKSIFTVRSSIDDISDFSLNFFEQMNQLQTVDEISRVLSDTIIRIIELMEKSGDIRKRKIVEKIINYLEVHYREPITLNDAAEKSYLNASYFSKIFKDETGEPFTRYLMRIRVKKAIELLNDPSVKIYEVAEKVGYEDVNYFIKVFKSIEGVTPIQYREKIK